VIWRAEAAEQKLWECLNYQKKPFFIWVFDWKWRRISHPVNVLHLKQISSHIHSILFLLRNTNSEIANSKPTIASLNSLLDQLDDASQLSKDNSWELAGRFERQLIEIGEDAYLYTILRDQVGGEEEEERTGPKRVPAIAKWNDYFSHDELEVLCWDYEVKGGFDGEFSNTQIRSKVRHALRHLHLIRSEEYRRDRGKIRLRARYLARMTPLIMALLVVLCVSYLFVGSSNTYTTITSLVPFSLSGPIPLEPGPPSAPLPPSEQPLPFRAYLLLLVFAAGALGGILSRAYRLEQQSKSVGTDPPTDEPSLGIRALISDGSSLLAQTALGGTAAIVSYLLLQLFAPDIPPVAYGLVGFLAGYSEPFFSRIIQQTGQMYSGI